MLLGVDHKDVNKWPILFVSTDFPESNMTGKSRATNISSFLINPTGLSPRRWPRWNPVPPRHHPTQ